MMSDLEIIHKPSDCLLLIAFALTEEEFINDLQTETYKDYAKSIQSQYKLLPHYLWQYHHLHLAQCIKSIAEQVQRYGVAVKLYTCLGDLQELSLFKVVTIIAHFNNKKSLIELSDRMHPLTHVVDAADNRFTGFFDLSVCNSVFLQDGLKTKFGDQCFVRANEEVAEIRFHLVLYKNIIERLMQADTNYLNEMMILRTGLAHLIQHKT